MTDLDILNDLLKNKTENTTENTAITISPTRQRSPSDEKDRESYKNNLKTLNTKEDLDWSLKRLENMDQS